jgi:hypothetical protein
MPGRDASEMPPESVTSTRRFGVPMNLTIFGVPSCPDSDMITLSGWAADSGDGGVVCGAGTGYWSARDDARIGAALPAGASNRDR